MKTPFLVPLFLCFLPIPSVVGQKSVSILPRAHASALQQFLTKHPELEFLPESECDKQILKSMRRDFGPSFTPFYRTGDFNRDGVPDFALILVHQGPPTGDQGSEFSETHRYLHDVTVVIFNGTKGGKFNVAFTKTTKAPLVCCLYRTFEKKQRLYFAVYETDEHFIMSPAGKGYIIEYEPDEK